MTQNLCFQGEGVQRGLAGSGQQGHNQQCYQQNEEEEMENKFSLGVRNKATIGNKFIDNSDSNL